MPQSYSEKFNRVWQQWLAAEGRTLVYDNGGATKFGISKRANPDVNVEGLSEDRAKEIFHERYYTKMNGDNPFVPDSAILFAGSAGVSQAWKILEPLLKQNPSQPEDIVGAFNDQATQYYSTIADSVSQKTGIPPDKLMTSWSAHLPAQGPSPGPSPVPTVPPGLAAEYNRIKSAMGQAALDPTQALGVLSQYEQQDFAPTSQGLPPVFGGGGYLGALATAAGGMPAVESQRQAILQSAQLAQAQQSENQRQQGLLQLRRQNIAAAKAGIHQDVSKSRFDATMEQLRLELQRTNNKQQFENAKALYSWELQEQRRQDNLGMPELDTEWSAIWGDPNVEGGGSGVGTLDTSKSGAARVRYDETLSEIGRSPGRATELVDDFEEWLRSRLSAHLNSPNPSVVQKAERMIASTLDNLTNSAQKMVPRTNLDAFEFPPGLSPVVSHATEAQRKRAREAADEGFTGKARNVLGHLGGMPSQRAVVDAAMLENLRTVAGLSGSTQIFTPVQARELLDSINAGLQNEQMDYLQQWQKFLTPGTNPGEFLGQLRQDLERVVRTPGNIGKAPSTPGVPEFQASTAPPEPQPVPWVSNASPAELLNRIQQATALVNGTPERQMEIGPGVPAIPVEPQTSWELSATPHKTVGFLDRLLVRRASPEPPELSDTKAQYLNELPDVPGDGPINKSRIQQAASAARAHANVLKNKQPRITDARAILDRVRKGGRKVVDAYGGMEQVLQLLSEAGLADPYDELVQALRNL